MIFKKFKAKNGLFEAIIEEDLPYIGYYLYIWKNGEGLCDYLQDTIEICKEQAFEEFGFPLNCWEEIKDFE